MVSWGVFGLVVIDKSVSGGYYCLVDICWVGVGGGGNCLFGGWILDG